MRFEKVRLTWIYRTVFCLMIACMNIACGSGSGGENVVPTGLVTGKVAFGNDDIQTDYVKGTLITLIAIPEDGNAFSGDLKSYRTVVDSLGQYSIRVPEGGYSVVAEGSSSAKAYGTVTVINGETSILDFMLAAAATLKGQIISDQFGYGAFIKLNGTQYETTCDINGFFTFYEVPLGTFTVSVYYSSDSYLGNFSVTIVPGINDLGEISDLRLQPVVVYMTAKENGILSHEELDSFSIVFNTSMARDITAEAVTVTAGSLVENLDMVWLNSQTLQIKGLEVVLGSYFGPVSVQVARDAQSLEGKTLMESVSVNFGVADKIVSTSPSDGYQFAYLESSDSEGGVSEIRVTFSADVDPESFDYIIQPTLTGTPKVQWEGDGSRSGNVAVIRGEFVRETDYTVTVSQAHVNGRAVAHLPYTFSFRTTHLMVYSEIPPDGAVDVQTQQKLYLRFNGKMNRESVVKGLSLQDTETGQPVDLSGWDWSSSAYYEASDLLSIVADLNYGTTYRLDIVGAQSINGFSMDDFTSWFSTVTPRIESSEYLQSGSIVQLRFNTNVFWDKDDFSITAVEGGREVDFDLCSNSGNLMGSENGKGYYAYIKPRAGLDPQTEYRFAWHGIEAHTSNGNVYTIDDGQFSFTTSPIQVDTTSPSAGQTAVSPTLHTVVYTFSSQISESVKKDIENALTVHSEIQGAVTELTPTFFWDINNSFKSMMYVDFLFEEGATYSLTIDKSLNAYLETLFAGFNPMTFTTRMASPNQVSGVFDRFNVEDYGVLERDYSSWQMVAYFNAYVDLKSASNQIVEIQDENGIRLPFTGAVSVYNTSMSAGSRTYAKAWLISGLPFSYGKSYSVSLSDQVVVFENGNSYTNNLPTSVSLTTERPSITVSVNNKEGLLVLSASSGFYFYMPAILNGLATEPQIDVVDEIYTEPGEDYSRRIGLRYKPVQTAHLRVMLPSFMAFEMTGSSGSEQYYETCAFAQTPMDRLFVIKPDEVPPVLKMAYPLDSHTLEMIFNTDLDAETARRVTNYSITDENGTDIPVLSVTLYPQSGSSEVPSDYSGPVGANVTLTTGSPLESGVVYKVTAAHVTEWGGHYEIAEGMNSVFFNGYDGAIVSVNFLSYRNQEYIGGALRTTYVRVIPVAFDVPVDKAAVERSMKVFESASYSYDYEEVAVDSILWNDAETACAVTVSSDANMYRTQLVFTEDIPNQSSEKMVYIGDYTRTGYTSGTSLSASCYMYSSAEQIRVTFSGSGSEFPGNYDKVSLYSLHHVSLLGLPAVTNVTGDPTTAYLQLSDALTSGTGTYLVRIDGLYDLRLSTLGLGEATPVISDTFTF